MSTDVLNSASSSTNIATVDATTSSASAATTDMESSPGSSSSSNSLLSPSNASPTNLTLAQTAPSTSSMIGAPTSVVVTVATHVTNNPSSSHNQPAQAGPSILSAGASTSQQYPVLTATQQPQLPEASSSSSSSSIQYITENFIQSMIGAQTVAAAAAAAVSAQQQSSLIQMTSSSSGSSGSQSTTGEPQQHQRTAPDLMKRTFEVDPSHSGSKSFIDPCSLAKRSKTSSSLSPPISSKSGWDGDGLTLRQKLEQRLNGILCCAVCLDLPRSSVYQCTNGHLMCAGCFTHVLADARLRDESPTCPSCRVSISKESCSRNLAVEKAVSELPGDCRFCQRELPRSMLEKHMNEVCEERIVPCRFSNIGCPWNGPYHEADYHANNCSHPNKSAREVLDHLEEQERKKREQRRVYETLFTLLSYEKISFHDVQFRPYRTDEYIHKLFYETSRFTAFNLQWVVKARVNDDQRDPTQSCQRHLSFQLCLKSKINNSLTIHYMLLKGPYGETKVLPMIYKFDFSESQTESTYNFINLTSTADSNRLLAARMINFRLIMFQASK